MHNINQIIETQSAVRDRIKESILKFQETLAMDEHAGLDLVSDYQIQEAYLPTNKLRSNVKKSVDSDFKNAWITPEDIQKRINKGSFSKYVLDYIDAHGLSDPDVYKAAGIDRRVFSKLRSIKTYNPKKKTALALCIGLKMTPGEAAHLLALAGYAFSTTSGIDVTVSMCLELKIYNIMMINQILEANLFETFDVVF